MDDAGRITRELYAAIEAGGAQQIGWKIGATDQAVQSLLGTDSPFAAPLYDNTMLRAGEPISLGSLVAPRLEPEIGLRFGPAGVVPLPCLEIADCRVRDWRVSLAGAIADFGLHGLVLFGEEVTASSDPEVVVVHNGTEVARARASLAAAARMIDTLAAGSLESGALVATGSVVPAIPLSAGTWHVAFGPLGELALKVDP